MGNFFSSMQRMDTVFFKFKSDYFSIDFAGIASLCWFVHIFTVFVVLQVDTMVKGQCFENIIAFSWKVSE